MDNTVFEKIFSVKNDSDRKHKIINILGLKLKINLYKNKGSIPYLETHICDHCNLNCKGCGHCSPLVMNEQFADFVQYEKDINILSKKLSIAQIRLMGGEPLLHPLVNKFIEATRKAFPKTDIRIVTNGILIPQMPESFWNTLKENNITIDMSKYPPCEKNFDKYLHLIKEKNIKVGNINNGYKFFSQVNSKGDSPIEETFANCLSKYCVNLWHSKLYTCPACYSYYYNLYFNENKPLPTAFDIYKASGKELEAALNKPIEFCRFCNTKELKYFDWEQSKKDKSEWM